MLLYVIFLIAGKWWKFFNSTIFSFFSPVVSYFSHILKHYTRSSSLNVTAILCLRRIIWMIKRSIQSDNYNIRHKNISNNGRKTFVERNFNLVFQTTHTMYVETSSFNHCCSGKSVTIIYTEGGFIALGIEYAMHMRHNLICGPSGSTIFFNIISHKKRFS